MSDTRPPKSPPHAFMRTANDEMPVRAFNLDGANSTASSMRPTSIPQRESIASASTVPASLTSKTDSPLISPPIAGVVRPKEDPWRLFALKLQKNQEEERALWREERDLLHASIVEKEDAIRRLSARLSHVANAMMGPDGTYNAPSSRTLSPRRTPMDVLSRKTSDEKKRAYHGVPGISSPAKNGPKASFSFAPPSIAVMESDEVQTSPNSATPDALGNEESLKQSRSSSFRNLSPPPPKNRLHAGHTPGEGGAPLSPTSEVFGNKTPTQATFEDPETQNNTDENKGNPSLDPNAGFEANMEQVDPELRSPLFLASKPENGQDTLEALQHKLEDISDNPKLSKPLVCAAYTDSEIESTADAGESPLTNGTNEHGDRISHGFFDAEQNGHISPPVQSAADVDIPLKLKPSVNFGKAFGRV
ncbi:hypothetical protein K402DRAFT_84582 [Aulographum hederae CBS 113979]|uniref:Uncharacterized protein n=1 Tax=Aulographum hederae CBS 113979 TaxID=1176131 RepID=A0A6G1H0A2_9PEZI|nr:hypothetical protein K402DRAFT_84582 [Aulographum hederae CBS 113979]